MLLFFVTVHLLWRKHLGCCSESDRVSQWSGHGKWYSIASNFQGAKFCGWTTWNIFTEAILQMTDHAIAGMVWRKKSGCLILVVGAQTLKTVKFMLLAIFCCKVYLCIIFSCRFVLFQWCYSCVSGIFMTMKLEVFPPSRQVFFSWSAVQQNLEIKYLPIVTWTLHFPLSSVKHRVLCKRKPTWVMEIQLLTCMCMYHRYGIFFVQELLRLLL